MARTKTMLGMLDGSGDDGAIGRKMKVTITFDISRDEDLRTIASIMSLAKKPWSGITTDGKNNYFFD